MSILPKRLCMICITSLGLFACTTIRDMQPNPAAAGQHVTVDLSGVIGSSSIEPGAELEFDGVVMSLNPDTSSQVGFDVPASAAAGPHTVTVTDRLGFIEIILIFPLFKTRTDTETLTVSGP